MIKFDNFHGFILIPGRSWVHYAATLYLVNIVSFMIPAFAMADERHFSYSYEPEVVQEGKLEFEQWLTSRLGKDDGDFARWEFREELEYGLTEDLTAALYLNFRDVYSSGVSGRDDQDNFEFTGISSEWKYQILNPHLSPIGLVAYGEVTTDGEELEIEAKIIAGAYIGNWNVVFNAAFEPEWEFEDGHTGKELTFEATTGVSYNFTPQWSAGLELRNVRAYPGGFDFQDEEFSAWFAGPAVHYGAPDWWVTFTILPQIYGNGDGAEDDLQLSHRERVEARLLVGVLL